MVQATTTPEAIVQETIRPITITRHRRGFAGAKELAAQEKGGELPSIKEFILGLKDEANYNRAKNWFWLREEPEFNLTGRCKINYEKGTLEPVTSDEAWRKLDADKRAVVLSGGGFMCIAIGLAVFADATSSQARVAYVLKERKNPAQAEELLRC